MMGRAGFRNTLTGNRAARPPAEPGEDISNSGTKIQNAKGADATTRICSTASLSGREEDEGRKRGGGCNVHGS